MAVRQLNIKPGVPKGPTLQEHLAARAAERARAPEGGVP
jgi:hypothetical protein